MSEGSAAGATDERIKEIGGLRGWLIRPELGGIVGTIAVFGVVWVIPMWMAILITFAICIAIGALNGLIVVRTGLPSFIVTLAFLLILRGFNLRSPYQAVGTLSGGERQTVAIARAVYFGAKALILDEQTSALGVRQTSNVLATVDRVRKAGIGVVFITHNVRPGGKAQSAHRGYHLGFMQEVHAGEFPLHMHELSPILTLQGGVAHCDVPDALSGGAAVDAGGGFAPGGMDAAVNAAAEGYAFPTHLDSDPPVGGRAPESMLFLFRRAMERGMVPEEFEAEMDKLAKRRAG
jgi:hypothetical protein